MKKIYIVLSYTGTILSRLIKIYTRKPYSHVSISLDKNLDHMYSFGRLKPYNPFIAGFVQESPHYGTFKRFKNSEIKIYSLDVTDEDYEKIKEAIQQIQNKREEYRFNIMGVVAAAGHYHLKMRNHFYCAEFVKHVLEHSSLQLDLPELIKPEDFQTLKGLHSVYTGIISEYDSM